MYYQGKKKVNMMKRGKDVGEKFRTKKEETAR